MTGQICRTPCHLCRRVESSCGFVDPRSPSRRTAPNAAFEPKFEGVDPVKNVDLKFLLLAAIMLTAGVGLGIRMGIIHDFSLAPVHAHINLVGWASLALFGIVYRLYPQMAESRLAGLHFILAAPAAVMFPVGIALSILAERPLVAIVASLLWMAGVLLFLINLIGQAFRPAAA
jgi:hypothetical protein